jgi:hypothetical protein
VHPLVPLTVETAFCYQLKLINDATDVQVWNPWFQRHLTVYGSVRAIEEIPIRTDADGVIRVGGTRVTLESINADLPLPTCTPPLHYRRRSEDGAFMQHDNTILPDCPMSRSSRRAQARKASMWTRSPYPRA